MSAKVAQSLFFALKNLPEVGSRDGWLGDLPAVYIFTPDARATWILWEFDKQENIAFGMCDLGLGTPELGYVNIDELTCLRGPLGLPVEVDRSIATRFDGMRNAQIEIPHFLLDTPELPKWIVKYVGFYFDMSVEVHAHDEDNAMDVADALIQDEMRVKIREYSHEVIVTPRDEA